jgi:hypothetical protein
LRLGLKTLGTRGSLEVNADPASCALSCGSRDYHQWVTAPQLRKFVRAIDAQHAILPHDLMSAVSDLAESGERARPTESRPSNIGLSSESGSPSRLAACAESLMFFNRSKTPGASDLCWHFASPHPCERGIAKKSAIFPTKFCSSKEMEFRCEL